MSSSSGSGAARFLPLISRAGSRMVRGISAEVGFRRGLNMVLSVRLWHCHLAAYRLLLREDSAATSFAFPFPAPNSRERLALTGLLREVRVLMDSSWGTVEVP